MVMVDVVSSPAREMVELPTAFPDGWAVVPLANLCTMARDSINPRQYSEETFQYYSIPAFQGTGAPIAVRGEAILSQKLLVREGCILFGKLNPRVPKIWRVQATTSTRKIASAEFLALVPREHVDGTYLEFLCWSPYVLGVAKGLVSGSTPSRQRVDPSAFIRIPVPRPPLGEQRAIARILTCIRQAVDVQDQVESRLRYVKGAIAAKLFREGLRGEALKQGQAGRMPESWSVVALGDVITSAQYGLSTRGERIGQYPILRMNCQVDGEVMFRDLQYVDLDRHIFERFRLVTGDLLFNRTNSIDLVGRTAIVRDVVPTVFASYLIRLRTDVEVVNPAFMNYYMNLPSTQLALKAFATRAIGQSNINASRLKQLPVPVPSLSEQAGIVTVLDSLTASLATVRRRADILGGLFSGMLHLLMSGGVRATKLVGADAP